MNYSFSVDIVFAMLFGWLIEEGTLENSRQEEIPFVTLRIYILFLDIAISKVDSDDWDKFSSV